MNRFSSLFVLPLALGLVLAEFTPTTAAPIVRPIPQSVAQGLSRSGASVTVWAGSGTNLDFTRTGETIQRAWLDDPHAVVVDFDAPLGQASVLHLKRVQGIHFPNLPETDATLLTIVTQSPYGKKTYLFEVGYGTGTPQYATLAVTPDNQASDRPITGKEVERGLRQAIARQLITPKSPVALRVQNFLALVQNGMPTQQAAERAEVSLAVITKLAELANPAPTPPSQHSSK